MSEGYGPIGPGSASAEPEPEREPGEPPESKMGRAHYAGMTEEEAADVWKREALCLGCLHAPICKHAVDVEGPLVVVSRCLAYLPAPVGGG